MATVTQSYCKHCRAPFNPKRAWQRYCKPEHKKAREQIIIDMIKELRGPITRAAIKMADAVEYFDE